MKFLSIFNSLGIKISSLMGISTPVNLLNGSNNQIQSPNNFFETILAVILKTFEKLGVAVIETILKLIYAIVKWLLTAIDFLFVLIRQMIGMNTDFSDVESLTKSDLIFKFVFSEQVISVIKGMIGFGILLIIIFSIFAIVKTEYNFAINGGSNSKKQVLSSALKSLFLMVIVPILFIGGLILSNAITKSLYMATAGGTDTSLGAQIFVTSGYDANLYRVYANNNLKIPITFNFDEVDESKDNVTGWGADGEIAELDQALSDFKNSSVWNRGYATFMMFYIDTFMQMDSVDKLEWGTSFATQNLDSTYNYTYDENIYTCRDQYYVMADFLDRSIKQENKIYIKTVEQVYEAYQTLPDTIKGKVPLDSSKIGKFTTGEKNVGDYYINVHYKDFGYKQTQIIHKAGALSESDGAVFILTQELLVEDSSGNIYSCYVPYTTSDVGTVYQSPGEPVVARGLFSEDGYPTAIKQEDGAIKFYRDDLNIPTLLDFFPTISYERPEGATEDLAVSLIKKGIEAISGVDVTQFIPYIYYSFDIFNLFTKASYNIVTLEDGYLRFDYNFSQDGYTMSNAYNMINLNVVVLVFASVIIIGMLLKVMFGVAHRVMDVTLLAISYPAVLSTYPLDNGSRFKNWTDIVLKKILSVYGLILGVNMVLWFFPVIDDLDLFSVESLQTSIDAGLLTSKVAVGFLNSMTELLFMLVAFTVLESAVKLFDSLITSNASKDSGIIADGTNTINDLAKLPKTAGNVISGKFFMDMGGSLAKTATSLIPGSAIVADMAGKASYLTGLTKANIGIANTMKDIKNGGKSDKEETTETENEDTTTTSAADNNGSGSANAQGGSQSGGPQMPAESPQTEGNDSTAAEDQDDGDSDSVDSEESDASSDQEADENAEADVDSTAAEDQDDGDSDSADSEESDASGDQEADENAEADADSTDAEVQEDGDSDSADSENSEESDDNEDASYDETKKTSKKKKRIEESDDDSSEKTAGNKGSEAGEEFRLSDVGLAMAHMLRGGDLNYDIEDLRAEHQAKKDKKRQAKEEKKQKRKKAKTSDKKTTSKKSSETSNETKEQSFEAGLSDKAKKYFNRAVIESDIESISSIKRGLKREKALTQEEVDAIIAELNRRKQQDKKKK